MLFLTMEPAALFDYTMRFRLHVYAISPVTPSKKAGKGYCYYKSENSSCKTLRETFLELQRQ